MKTKQKSKEEKRVYMREWRKKNKEKLREVNRRYYQRNKEWLNKSRTLPWEDEKVVKKILGGDRFYINLFLRILRPHKDPFLKEAYEQDDN